LLAGLAGILTANIEVAALGDRRLVDRGHRQLRRFRSRRGRSEQERRRKRGTGDTRRDRDAHGFPPAAAPARHAFLDREGFERDAPLPALSIESVRRAWRHFVLPTRGWANMGRRTGPHTAAAQVRRRVDRRDVL